MPLSRQSNQRGSATVVLVVVILVFICAVGAVFVGQLQQQEAEESAEQMNRVQLEYLIHQEVNEKRTEHGLEPLKFDTELRPVARGYSKQMATEGFFSHYSPDGEGFEDRYEKHGYECKVEKNETHVLTGGENLAQSYYNQPVNTTTGEEVEYKTLEALAEGVVRGWLHSPDHRENLLTPAWEREAIGVYVTENNTVFVTQNFC